MQPQLPINVDPDTGVWTTDALPSGVGKDRQHDAGNQPNGNTRGFEVGHLHDMHSNNLGALAKVAPVT